MKNKNKNLVIIGAGSLGLLTLDAALEMGQYMNVYFVDDKIEKDCYIHQYKVIGGTSLLKKNDFLAYDFVIAIANNKIRKEIAKEYELNYVNIIHPKAAISRFARIGKGNIILANTSIDPNVDVKNHVIVNKNNSIGHDSILENYSQVSPGCGFGGHTILQQGANMGICSSTLPNIVIGEYTKVGAGAVVTKDIPSNATAVGIPAKVIKEGGNYVK